MDDRRLSIKFTFSYIIPVKADDVDDDASNHALPEVIEASPMPCTRTKLNSHGIRLSLNLSRDALFPCEHPCVFNVP